MKKNVGFTLIELMITIAIFAILLGIGIPSYQNTVQQNRIDDASALINSALSHARNAAIAHNRPLYMTASNNTLTLATNTVGAVEIINKVTIDPASDSYLSFSDPAKAIVFRANGTIKAGNTINYTPGDDGISMIVSTDGSTTMKSVSSTGY